MCREPSVLTSWPCAGRARVWLQQASGGAEVGSLGYGFPYCSQPVSSAVGVLPGGRVGTEGWLGEGRCCLCLLVGSWAGAARGDTCCSRRAGRCFSICFRPFSPSSGLQRASLSPVCRKGSVEPVQGVRFRLLL